MFARISRTQLLAVTGWSTIDLDNRVRHNQVAYAFGLTLPAESGAYVGPDCFALKLSDALVDAGFTRAQAGLLVRQRHEEWWHGLERIEWPQMYPAPEPMISAPTKWALDLGIKEFPPDAEIYFAIAKNPDGAFQAVCGTMLENAAKPERIELIRAAAPAPIVVTQVNLRWVYEVTLAAAAKAGVDLSAPFTRPEGHPGHREWYAARGVHRALALARQKVRNPPGPARAKKVKAKAKKLRREREAKMQERA